jgi:hypothetical protein
MHNLKSITTEGQNATITREADVQLAYDAILTRNRVVTLFLLDDSIDNGGEGMYGEVLLFAQDKTEESGEVQAWEITAKPAAHGTGFKKYPTSDKD